MLVASGIAIAPPPLSVSAGSPSAPVPSQLPRQRRSDQPKQDDSSSSGFADLSMGDLNSPHAPKIRDTTPSLTQVSRERDRFIDEDHKPLDAEIMETFSAFRRHNEEPGLPALLSLITIGDERLVSLSPRETGELLTRQPSITTILQNAWKKASFKEVRQLGAFCVPRSLFLSP